MRDRADPEVMGALRDEQADGAIALHLQGKAAFELQRRGEQHRGGGCLAEQVAHGRGIGRMLAQRRPTRLELHELPAHRVLLEQEAAHAIGAGSPAHGPASFLFSRSLSCAGFALPCVAFMA